MQNGSRLHGLCENNTVAQILSKIDTYIKATYVGIYTL